MSFSYMTNKERFNRLIDYNAQVLGEFTNDLGQRMRFYEDPVYGEDADILVGFIDFGVAFRTGFFDLNDMTAKLADVISAESCIKFDFDPSADSDYVPRYVDGKYFLKFEE